MSFKPYGRYNEANGIYDLGLQFEAQEDGTDKIVLSALCVFTFKFDQPYKFTELPEYFFTNSIPIGFPYLRAFVSNITLQANIDVIMLDLVKFSDIAQPLKESTQVYSSTDQQ